MEPTFAQAQGIDPMPSQARIGTISQATAAALWRIFYDAIRAGAGSRNSFSSTTISAVLKDWWVLGLHQMIDRAPATANGWVDAVRPVFDDGFRYAYNFVQFVLDHRQASTSWKTSIAKVLGDTLAAYRVVDGKIVPFASDAEFKQFTAALSSAATSGANGARAHLIQAGVELTAGRWEARFTKVSPQWKAQPGSRAETTRRGSPKSSLS